MGGDGGTIHGRQDMVRKKEKEVQLVRSDDFYQLCALSRDPLEHPVVYCGLGRLFNKESLVLYLLEIKTYPEVKKDWMSHITSLKDVHNCKIYHIDLKGERVFGCPIALLPCTAKYPFVVIEQCGCVLSLKAVNDIDLSHECVQCGAPFDKGVMNTIPLFLAGSEEKSKRRQLQKLKTRKRKRKESKSKFTSC